MDIQIEDERVRRNVLFFLHLLSVIETAKEIGEAKRQRAKVYSAFLNKVNGEIFFPDLLPEKHVIHSKEWKQVVIRSVPMGAGESVLFELEEPGSLEPLSPLASQVIRSTLSMLGHVSSVMKKTHTIQQGLAELARLHIQKALSNLETCPLRRLSLPLSRWQAEEILSRHPYGSFLFRKDEFATLLEEQLGKLHQRPVMCHTLSFSEPGHKVTDLTLVTDRGELLLYDDDPSLDGKRYGSLTEVLELLHAVCKYPLF